MHSNLRVSENHAKTYHKTNGRSSFTSVRQSAVKWYGRLVTRRTYAAPILRYLDCGGNRLACHKGMLSERARSANSRWSGGLAALCALVQLLLNLCSQAKVAMSWHPRRRGGTIDLYTRTLDSALSIRRTQIRRQNLKGGARARNRAKLLPGTRRGIGMHGYRCKFTTLGDNE